MTELLTHSRLKSYRACARQHRYAYTLGYRPAREASALTFGTAIHAALEAYWRTRQRLDADAARFPGDLALEAALAALPEFEDAYVLARARAMLVFYAEQWDARAVEVLAVERVFELPLLNPESGCASRTFRLAGKLDLVLRLEDGRTAVVEHKTSSADVGAGSAYQTQLALDGQVSQYFDGADALGFAADLCVYDVLVKPALKPLLATPVEQRRYTKGKPATRTKPAEPPRLDARQRDEDESPAAYEQRLLEAMAAEPHRHGAQIEVPRLEDERAEYRFDVWQLAELIRFSERTGRAPKNPDACFKHGSPCSFLDVCLRAASLDDPTRFVRLADVHRELREQPAA